MIFAGLLNRRPLHSKTDFRLDGQAVVARSPKII